MIFNPIIHMVSQYFQIILLGVFSFGMISSANAQQANLDSEFSINDPLFIATFGSEKLPIHVKDDTFFVYYDFTDPPKGIKDELKVSSISLVEENKSLLIKIENATYLSHMAFLFPDELINAEDHAFRLLVDNIEKDYEITHFNTHTNIDIMVQPGTNKIEIIGTHVIPEFGSIVAWVLIVGIMSVIIATRKKMILQSYTKF